MAKEKLFNTASRFDLKPVADFLEEFNNVEEAVAVLTDIMSDYCTFVPDDDADPETGESVLFSLIDTFEEVDRRTKKGVRHEN